jgi:hypothetical protein
MRRVLLGALAGAILAAGCGSSSTGSSATPLQTVLSYYPAQSPFVLTVSTDPNSASAKADKAIEARVPFVSAIKAAELARLRSLGGIGQSLKALVGDPAAVGEASPSGRFVVSDFLVAWLTTNAGKLSALVKKLHVHQTGTLDGATLYGSAAGGAFAVSGPMLLLAPTRLTLIAAIVRHARHQGITAAQHAAALAGLDVNAAVQVFGNLEQVLSQPSAAKARRIPWVAAIRSYGAAIGVAPSALTFRFRLSTEGSALPPSELPLASGSSSPSLVDALPIQTGIHDPAHIFDFLESAEQTTSPASFAKFRRREARVKRKTGVDIDQLIGQLSGDLIVNSDSRTTLARVKVSDPAAVSTMLTKLSSVPGTFGNGARLERVGPATFSLVESGRRSLLGVVGSQLVLAVPAKRSVATPAALRSFAFAPAAPLSGQSGAVVFRLHLDELIALLDKHPPSGAGRSLLALLGDLTGSVSATPAALTGNATLAIR